MSVSRSAKTRSSDKAGISSARAFACLLMRDGHISIYRGLQRRTAIISELFRERERHMNLTV